MQALIVLEVTNTLTIVTQKPVATVPPHTNLLPNAQVQMIHLSLVMHKKDTLQELSYTWRLDMMI